MHNNYCIRIWLHGAARWARRLWSLRRCVERGITVGKWRQSPMASRIIRY